MVKNPPTLERVRDDVRTAWQRFLDVVEPLRPDLYRYCRHLTGNAWDAEDLVQDACMRAFVTMGTLFADVPQPRAWLLRTASNLWIDHVRRGRHEVVVETPQDDFVLPDPRTAREAAGTLLVKLSPQERAAVVLKDVFDFSLLEIAEALRTSEGAIKAALHRGRERLSDTADVALPSADRRVLDSFCTAFNNRDLDGMAKQNMCSKLGVPYQVNGYQYW